jgi:hypothetical protein
MSKYNQYRQARLKVEGKASEISKLRNDLYFSESNSDMSLFDATISVLNALSARLFELETKEDLED